MTIRLRTEGKISLYEQIYEHIRNEIRNGKLLPGERLPSTRSMAEYLQVARSTVEYAYGQLMDEGYIESRPYRGYFVRPMEEMFCLGEMAAKEVGSGKNPGRGNRDGQEGEEKESVYDFSPYDVDMSGFPFGAWRKITGKILSDANSDLFSKGQSQGDPGLREAIGRYLHSSRGVNCVPEQIIVGAGNDYLLMLLEKILGRSVRIAMENPTYKRSYRLFRSFAYDIAIADMDGSGMRADSLEETGARVAYVMPSHQFPLGTVMPIGRRLELLKWAEGSEDRYLIEDDYDSEFRFRGKPIPALQAADRHGKVIYIGSFSKAIAPAIRVSFMVLPYRLLEIYKKECSFYSCTVSRIDQSILDEFIRDGYFERHLNKMRKIYRAKHDLLLDLLQPFQDSFCISGENAGLHLVLAARNDAAEEKLVREGEKRGVKVYGVSECLIAESCRRATILLGFGGMTAQQITEGARRLQEAWRIPSVM